MNYVRQKCSKLLQCLDVHCPVSFSKIRKCSVLQETASPYGTV